MVDAPVGFQCRECVAKAESTSASPLGPMGAAVIRDAYVTKAIIGICVALFAIEFVAGVSSVVFAWGMSPSAVSLGGEWWRLLTAAFLHGGLLHLAFNMYVLWVLGPTLESLFGHVRFTVLYLVSALAGSVASYTFGPFNTLSVGASGAIFGLMAALIVAGHHLRRDVTQVVFLMAINVVIGFLAPGIDWRAHLGGALSGVVVAGVLAYAPKQSRTLWQVLGILAWLGVLVVVFTLRTGQIQQQLPTTRYGPAPAGAASGVQVARGVVADLAASVSTGSPHLGKTTSL